MILAWLAALALVAGTTCLYTATPHQALLTGPARGPVQRWIGFVCLTSSLVLLLLVMGPATAVFTWTVGAMLMWSVPPIVVRWLRYRKENAG